VVEKDGSITDVTLLRGIGGGCDEEALRVISMMPDWKPGLQRNHPVRVQFVVDIKFILEGI
jgi:protein TonB